MDDSSRKGLAACSAVEPANRLKINVKNLVERRLEQCAAAFAVACARFLGREDIQLSLGFERPVGDPAAGQKGLELTVICTSTSEMDEIVDAVAAQLRAAGLAREVGEAHLASEGLYCAFGEGRIGLSLAGGAGSGETIVEWEGGWLDEGFVRSLSEAFISVLDQIAQGKTPPVSRVRLAGPEISSAALSSIPSRRRFDTPLPLHEAFDHWAERTPQAAAVRDGGRVTTYAALRAMSLAVAARLQRSGVGRGALVGLLLKPGAAQIAAILGVLRAGAAYVPVGADAPPSRQRELFEGCKVAAVLAEDSSPLAGAFDPSIDILDVGEALAADSESFEPVRVEPADLCYVIHTSGTTGNPKGVLVAHRHVLRMFAAAEEMMRIEPTDVWSVFHAYTFDFQVWEMWGALLHGGALALVDEQSRLDPVRMIELLDREGVTVLNQTPSAFLQLVEAEAGPPAERWPRIVLLDGEPLPFRAVEPWLARRSGTGTRLIHTYGITETTIHATWRDVTLDDARSEVRNLCGRPFADLSVDVVDERLEPVPIGAVGEVYIGGDGVACGYFGEQAGESEKFIANPAFAGGRGYRTGDLGRISSCGEVEILGRADHQVKVRGYRIDLTEVERALAEHPAVAKAVAFKSGDALRAVAERVPGTEPEEGEARLFASKRLLPQAVPASVLFVDRLALTVNGKIDRRAAMALESKPTPPSPRLAAHSTEATLAAIWQELLARPTASAGDNFFMLGGTSLDFMKLVRRVNDAFGTEFAVADLYALDDLAEMASLIDSQAVRPLEEVR